jgi:hypothetical protein
MTSGREEKLWIPSTARSKVIWDLKKTDGRDASGTSG